MYTRKIYEKIVSLADKDGYISFDEIYTAFPESDSSFFYDLIDDDFKENGHPTVFKVFDRKQQPILSWVNCPPEYSYGYIFKPSDRFKLSAYGEDIQYELDKNRRNTFRVYVSLLLSLIAAIAAVISALR